jgi:hypothetical protein
VPPAKEDLLPRAEGAPSLLQRRQVHLCMHTYASTRLCNQTSPCICQLRWQKQTGYPPVEQQWQCAEEQPAPQAEAPVQPHQPLAPPPAHVLPEPPMITTHPLNGPRVVSPQEAPGHLALQPQAGNVNMVQMVVTMMMQTMQRQDHMMGMMIENTIRSNGPAGPPFSFT